VTRHPPGPLLWTSRTLYSIKFFVVTIISCILTCQIDRKYFLRKRHHHGRTHMGSADPPPRKMDEKLKSENMQNSSFLFLCYILRAIRAGRCREQRYADHIFIQIYFRMRHLIRYRSQFFKIFFCLRTSNAGVAVRTADGSRRTANAGDEQWLRCACSSPSCTVIRCYLPPGRCWRRAMSEVWMQQSVTYCGAVCCRRRWTVAHSLYCTPYLTLNQWRRQDFVTGGK